ncbi:NAD(P)/FAD-dependent oxidoreductase [Thalassococcus sp. S3]|uniref:NAD(P)/FAD-dependent oxidoreductase n=1 Tax=Thalassococcus sp. S3 TaxID=2017482 RepID=UPI0010244B5A|nr:FAD-dependent oxidoreductase [Thalassococcus sp. S3]QBF33140.1 pyridine nucleotide-disulfide oxidoreductase [Thalassococcus sp. S3]
MSQIVVVGAGQAGASLTAELRKAGFDGDVTLIGAEPVPPYQRPPLSKAYLLGEMAEERLYLRPERFYEEQSITLKLGKPVSALDAGAKTVTLGDEVLSYDQLALTTGSTPRLLPGAIGGDLGNVFTVRTLRDVDAMAPAVAEGAKALIVGGGYIGLEAAAVAAKRGVDVTLVEMADRILQRVAAPETSAFFRDLHTRHGVKILEGVGLERLTGDGDVSGAVLSDGTELSLDFVVVGVGILPETTLAEAAGLALDNGIAVDETGRSSDPSIWAAGDCASFPFRDARIRLESVPHAIDQAELVARNMLGAGEQYTARPWFWSDQYDVKLQIAGLNSGYDHVVTRNSGPATSVWYYQGETLLAVDAMNDPRAYMIGKRMIEAGKSPAPEAVSNPETDLKSLLRA